jgi:leucyl/phenylalanyl-tRNA---protein transferase
LLNIDISILKKKDNILISPKNLIKAYMLGYFPMAESRKDKNFILITPEHRALIPIEKFHVSKSLSRLVKKRPFTITINQAFSSVIKNCATMNRDGTWINLEIEKLFISLNKMKYAHSVECWDKNKLVGGIYGLAVGGIFFAESMFSSVPNGSKVALLNLVARLWKTGFKILDVQFLNDHLIQFGAYEVGKVSFKKDLKKVIGIENQFDSFPSTDNDFFESLLTFLQDRIDKS